MTRILNRKNLPENARQVTLIINNGSVFCMTSKNVFLIEFIYFHNILEKPFFENIEHILHVICHVIRLFKIQSMAVSIQSR